MTRKVHARKDGGYVCGVEKLNYSSMLISSTSNPEKATCNNCRKILRGKPS